MFDAERLTTEKTFETNGDALAFGRELCARMHNTCESPTHIGTFVEDEHGDYDDDLREVDEGTGKWQFVGHSHCA